MDIYESRQLNDFTREVRGETMAAQEKGPKNRPLENTEVWKVDDDRNLFAPSANCQDCRLALAGKRRMAGVSGLFLAMGGRCAKL